MTGVVVRIGVAPAVTELLEELRGRVAQLQRDGERALLRHRRLGRLVGTQRAVALGRQDRKSTRLNSSHVKISYAVFCLKKKKIKLTTNTTSIKPSKELE